MGWNDHIFDTPLERELEKCKNCGKTYVCSTEDQIPGFRDKEYDYCPFCGNINASSMDVDFLCRKLTDSEIQYLKKKGIVITKEDVE